LFRAARYLSFRFVWRYDIRHRLHRIFGRDRLPSVELCTLCLLKPVDGRLKRRDGLRADDAHAIELVRQRLECR
jgi:hypothetical protein